MRILCCFHPSRKDSRPAVPFAFGTPYIHSVFDVAAWMASLATFWLTTRYLLPASMLPGRRVEHPGAYAIAAGSGALCGAMFFGTLNALLSGQHAIGFSMAGGIAGAIAAVEAFKRLTGVTGSTGIVFAAPLAITIAIGRLGCFFAGLADFTYGTATDLPWGVDFGDGGDGRAGRAASCRFRPLLARQRLLPRRRLVRPPALRLGIPQALRGGSRAV